MQIVCELGTHMRTSFVKWSLKLYMWFVILKRSWSQLLPKNYGFSPVYETMQHFLRKFVGSSYFIVETTAVKYSNAKNLTILHKIKFIKLRVPSNCNRIAQNRTTTANPTIQLILWSYYTRLQLHGICCFIVRLQT